MERLMEEAGRWARAALALAVAAWLAVALAAPAAAAAAAQKRVALVVGNSDYQAAGRLRNPANDAADIAAALEKLGFAVTTGIDLDVNQFAQKLAAFSQALQRADVGLFYYAGHGLQFEDENYLLPVDAKLENQFSVRRETIPLDEIVAQMESAAHISVVVLDACRNNPLSENLQRSLKATGRSAAVGRGLARVRTRGSDTMIAFSAGPDQVAEDGDGRNSPFTSALLRHIDEPVEISTLFKRVRGDVEEATQNRQSPEQLTRMSSEFYFVGGQAPAAPQTAAPPPAAGSDRDLAAFQVAQSVGTVAAWDAFLAQFAASDLADMARAARDKVAGGGQALASREQDKLPPQGAGGGLEATAVRCGELAGDPNDPAKQGPGVAWDDIDAEAALAACRPAQATAPDDPALAFLLARSLERAGQAAQAAPLYRKAADAGYAAAEEATGRLLRDGVAGKADPIEAVLWLRKAAEKGSASAMTALGLMYAHGTGVAQNDREAVAWYRKGAEAGFPTAMNNLAFMLTEGRGAPRDDAEAIQWYTRAADAGHGPAMYNLAWKYDSGDGVAADPARAAKLFMGALRAGAAGVADSLSEHADSLAEATRRALQRELQSAGFYGDAIDGRFGPGTRRAIAAAAGG